MLNQRTPEMESGNAALIQMASGFEQPYFHFTKIDRVAFRLQRNVSVAEYEITIHDQFLCRWVAFVQLRFLVRQHDLTVDHVTDLLSAPHLDFDRDPLVAVIRFRR